MENWGSYEASVLVDFSVLESLLSTTRKMAYNSHSASLTESATELTTKAQVDSCMQANIRPHSDSYEARPLQSRHTSSSRLSAIIQRSSKDQERCCMDLHALQGRPNLIYPLGWVTASALFCRPQGFLLADFTSTRAVLLRVLA